MLTWWICIDLDIMCIIGAALLVTGHHMTGISGTVLQLSDIKTQHILLFKASIERNGVLNLEVSLEACQL